MFHFDVNWWLVLVPLCFCLLDCVTGFIGAAIRREISSTKLREGIMHKLAFALALVFGVVLQCSSQVVDLGVEVPSMLAICVYIVFTECISIVENICKMNPVFEGSGIFAYFEESKTDKGVIDVEIGRHD